uniref:Uncharacterized protein n=1 Tax=Tetranychus urticae TaxID=32264 RepID=T1KLA7_TETUR
MKFQAFLKLFLLLTLIPGNLTNSMFLCFSLICGSIPYAARTCCKTSRSCCDSYQSWLEPLLGPERLLGEFAKTFLELKSMYSPKRQRDINTTRLREPRDDPKNATLPKT